MLNKQGPGKIETCDWTWNPISGCLHDCPYCYMKRMEKRFPGMMEPKVKINYMNDISKSRKLKPGDKVFVGSSGDVFGEWVSEQEILCVLLNINLRKDVTFQFLTKNPIRYQDFFDNIKDKKNIWIGTTIDGTKRTENNLDNLTTPLMCLSGVKQFVSFEPLINEPEIDLCSFAALDWIIIGANSNKGAKKPPKEWADRLIGLSRSYGIPVWVKDNYGYPETIKEFPVKK